MDSPGSPFIPGIPGAPISPFTPFSPLIPGGPIIPCFPLLPGSHHSFFTPPPPVAFITFWSISARRSRQSTRANVPGSSVLTYLLKARSYNIFQNKSYFGRIFKRFITGDLSGKSVEDHLTIIFLLKIFHCHIS